MVPRIAPARLNPLLALVLLGWDTYGPGTRRRVSHILTRGRAGVG
jgi:hypothetical protein